MNNDREQKIVIYDKPIHDCPTRGLQPIMGSMAQIESWLYCPFCGEKLGEVVLVPEDIGAQ